MSRTALTAILLVLTLSLTACNSQTKSVSTPSNGAYTLNLGTSAVSVTEGAGAASVTLSVTRDAGHTLPISLRAEAVNANDAKNLRFEFQNDQLAGNENSTAMLMVLDIGVAPLPASSQREIRITASDGTNSDIQTTISINITPTDKDDIYLLAGQSNMVGFSEDGAKRSAAGQIDAPNNRIFQLNVTGNDQEHFRTASDFTDPAQIAVADPRYPSAVDPLHEGFDTRINDKMGSKIGLGLQFAKETLPNTTADIYLVPTAWSDTGFCRRDTNLVDGLGWLPEAPPANSPFTGTLLHDRALARLNLVLEETDGIFRGILWHQGEGDSDDTSCAAAYAANLQSFIESIRSKARVDARGAEARGPQANIPLVVGTMSAAVGEFPEAKQVVETALRMVGNNIPFSDVVLTDDLVPPAYACGDGCVHYGALAYREMGVRYAAKLRAIQQR